MKNATSLELSVSKIGSFSSSPNIMVWNFLDKRLFRPVLGNTTGKKRPIKLALSKNSRLKNQSDGRKNGRLNDEVKKKETETYQKHVH